MNRLKSIEEWQTLLERSEEQPFLLFKLSVTSLSSVTAKKEMESLVTDLPRYVVISQFDKKVSNAVESDTGVKHETPQLFIIKNKKRFGRQPVIKSSNRSSLKLLKSMYERDESFLDG